ncbi:MAG TPA: TVP38/TMEM64 family protein [Candidatus Babeliales bacterium]|nr:TVP38/TMEM64 family protein [Candidatus Babeliales bacterium]
MDVDDQKNGQGLKRWLPLIFLMAILFLFFLFHLNRYISFESLKTHREELLRWTNQHYVLTVSIYILLYIIAVAISIPGAVFFTLAGGFLFGTWLAALYAIIGATIGATILFLAVRLALSNWITKKSGRFLQQMEKGFRENAFYYLLTLRLIPLFPFWLVNVIPALLDVRLLTFITATALGIIPGALVYASLGNGLGKLFETNQSPNLNIILQPAILLPLLGLAILSLLPVLYQYIRGSRR